MSNQREDQRELRMKYVDAEEIGLPTGPIDEVANIRNALQHATDEYCNVLEPLVQLQYIPPNHQVAITIVQFTIEGLDDGQKFTNNGLWYREENGDLALSGKALGMIASAAGVQTIPGLTYQLPPTDLPGFWRCQAGVKRKDMTGEWRTEMRKHELDLRFDDTPAAKRMSSAAMVARARQNGLMLCESKAYNRAVRHVMAIKGSYNWDEARAPFVFCRLLYTPPNTREVLLLQAAAEFGVAAEVFGGGVLAEESPTVRQVEEAEAEPVAEPTTTPEARRLQEDPLHGQDPLEGVKAPQREKAPTNQRRDEKPAQQEMPNDAGTRWGPTRGR